MSHLITLASSLIQYCKPSPQTMMAISQIWKEIFMHTSQLNDVKPKDYCKRMLVLSLGTGEAKREEKYTADIVSKWGWVKWGYDNGASPLLDAFMYSSSDAVDFHVSTIFQALSCKKNYLRIQVPNGHIY